MSKKKKRKKKRKLKRKFKYFIFFIICLCFSLTFVAFTTSFEQGKLDKIKQQEAEQKKKIQENEYNICLNEKYNDKDNTEELKNKEVELTNYLKNNYSTSVKYYDVKTGYTYEYNPSKNYYAASTIKMLDAIYIYEKAMNNELNLDDTVTYKASNKQYASAEMKNYKVGDKVSLRNLVKYAITVSDNTAHSILVDYIGFQTLKNYGKSLGATSTLVGGDNFGTMNVHDAIIYITKLDELINKDVTLGSELQSYFVNSDQNYLNFPEENIQAAQKYGQYEIYYHENGIVYTPNKYYVSILTSEGQNKSGFEKVIRNINTKVNELHQTFYQNRQDTCYNYVYNQEQ